MNSIKFSVIIPVYNVEKYLRQCIESVLSQDYDNYEIILINDGSTDHSFDICKNYKAMDKKIVLLNQNNQGAAAARNNGIKHATGDYLMFLDSDDFWYGTNVFNIINKRLQIFNIDVLMYSYAKYFEDTKTVVPYFKIKENAPTTNFFDNFSFVDNHNLYIASACNKVIKKNIFNDNLLFELGNHSEDIVWSAELLLKINSIDFISENFYYYRQNPTSTTHTIDVKKCEDLCKNILKCISLNKCIDDKKGKLMNNYIAYQFGTFFKVQAMTKKIPKKQILMLKKYNQYLKYDNGIIKIKILNIFCRIFGMLNTCRFIRLLSKFI